MPAPRARAVPFLELLEALAEVSSPIRLRVALDLLEPLAASPTKVRLVARRTGSRFMVDHVQIGARGKAKVVGRGNRSGVQVLLWEVLTGQHAKGARLLPLGVFVDDAEPEVAHVVNSVIVGSKELTDARALFKALVMASAGCVATHRDVAKMVAQHLRAAAAAAEPKRSRRPAAQASKVPPPAPVSKQPPPSRPSKRPRSIDPAATLDDIVGEELLRLAPEGWDGWQLAPVPRVQAPAPAAAEAAAPARASKAPEASSGAPGLARPPAPTPPSSGRNQPRPDVVLVEPDPVTMAHLASALRRAGYAVEVCGDPDAAVTSACATQPRCVIYDDEFLEVAGPSVALRARTNSPRACLSPFIFLSARRAEQNRVAKAGARDVWLEKPFSTDDLLAKVAAFVGPPAARESNHSSMLPPAAEAVMRGDLAHISLRTVLSMLELERRSGTLEVSSEGRLATVTFRNGRAGRARVTGRPVRAAEAIEIAATWERGHFSFAPAGSAGVGDGWASAEMAQRSGH